MKVFCYVQHLLGVGHVMRFAAISRALCAQGLDVHVIFGGVPVETADFGAATVHYLPPAWVADERFKPLLNEAGNPVDEAWKARRTEQLLALYDQIQPDKVMIELFPFGRSQFRHELLPLLDKAKDQACPIYCSVRDILVKSSKPEKEQRMVDWALRYFDFILVHGDPKVITFDQTFPQPDLLSPKVRYTGYVVNKKNIPVPEDARAGEIIVSMGSGAIGLSIVKMVVKVAPLMHSPIRLLVGQSFPADHHNSLDKAEELGVLVETARADFPALLTQAGLSVSMGGYNTMMDVLRANVPAVIVPFRKVGEEEQEIRATLLAEKGWLHVMDDPDTLSAQEIADVLNAAQAAHHARTAFDTKGAEETARILLGESHGIVG